MFIWSGSLLPGKCFELVQVSQYQTATCKAISMQVYNLSSDRKALNLIYLYSFSKVHLTRNSELRRYNLSF